MGTAGLQGRAGGMSARGRTVAWDRVWAIADPTVGVVGRKSITLVERDGEKLEISHPGGVFKIHGDGC
jgi:hypothetical protein